MKENILKKVLNKENILIIIVIALAVATFSFNILVEANDELWNFSNIYKMSYGEEIYKDCNVIVTPLFFYIGQILFEILGANYLVFRIYNLILYSLLFYLIFKLLRKLELPKVKAITYLIIIYFIICLCIPIGANYNILAFIFVLLGIIYNIDVKEKKFEILIQGLLLSLVFMSKQSIGILYLCGVIFNYIIKKDDIKRKIGNILKTVGVFLILFILYIIYLYSIGSLWNFVNYTILGLFEFKDNNILFDGYIWILCIEFIISIFMIFTIIKKKNKIEQKVKSNILTLICFSIPLLFNSYPIFNSGHILLSSIFVIIAIIYFIERILLVELINNKIIFKALKIFDFMAIIIILILFGIMNFSYIQNIQNNIYDVYFGGIINNQNDIQKVIDYIKEQKEQNIEVKILSYKANLYNNILKVNNGKIDLPFYGNLGIDGIEGIIKEINNMKNINILITKEGIKYQESQELRDYIMNNYEQIGEIEEFYIYKVGY